MARMLGGHVAFPVPVEVAFDYLSDPVHRAEWQSSLRRVESVVGPVGEGQSWVDVTVPGLRPAMRTTTYDRPRVWCETGTTGRVRADLDLRFTPTPEGCDVGFEFRIHLLGPLGLAATAISVLPVRADLRHAARLLDARTSG